MKFDGKFFVHRSWVLEQKTGHWSHKHTHPNSILSGVMYLDVPEGSGEIQFDKPENYHNWINTDTLRFMVEEYHQYNCHNLAYQLKTIMFCLTLFFQDHNAALAQGYWRCIEQPCYLLF